MRPIDLDEIEFIKAESNKEFNHGVDCCINTLLKAPILDVKPVIKGEWTPISERLPKNDGRYLAYIVNKYDDKLQYIMTCDYSGGYWFPDDECASNDVIAWMPLPEPYKAESEE